MPKRVVRSRRSVLPEGAIYVGRPTRWGNPFKIGAPAPGTGIPMTREQAITGFKTHCGPMGMFEIEDANIQRLRGHDLACWCPLDVPCHADVLIEWANR